MVTLTQKRKQAPRLPEMTLLESEVNELWDSQIYFKDEPNSRQAIDLLLGTQVRKPNMTHFGLTRE